MGWDRMGQRTDSWKEKIGGQARSEHGGESNSESCRAIVVRSAEKSHPNTRKTARLPEAEELEPLAHGSPSIAPSPVRVLVPDFRSCQVASRPIRPVDGPGIY